MANSSLDRRIAGRRQEREKVRKHIYFKVLEKIFRNSGNLISNFAISPVFLYRHPIPAALNSPAMLRTRLTEALKTAMKSKEARTVSTVRLILAAIKDRDIAHRATGEDREIGDDEILLLLQSMVKQRRESIALYEKGGRQDLADQETEEIEVIKRFLPVQITGKEMETTIGEVINEIGACNLKDTGRTMAALKKNFAGRMDFAEASRQVRKQLS
jgi:uncharacterized protein YqeY